MMIKSVINFARPMVLATASFARRKLVADAGIKFIPDSVEIDESWIKGESLNDYVSRLAKAKADAVIPTALNAVIVSVDTAIGFRENILGKPSDKRHAREMLAMLSGGEHDVASAITIRDILNASFRTEVTVTKVEFVEMTDRMIDWYLSTGEWTGRAGAYAIQGRGAAFVSSIKGCYTNVIGISIPVLIRMLSSVDSRV